MYFAMSQYFVHITLKPYLRQWLVNEFGAEPISFPKGSAEADLLEFLLKRPPKTKIDASVDSHQRVAIELPFYKHKNVRDFNYISPRGEKALERLIYIRFQVQMWEELHTVDNTYRLIGDVIYCWLEKHGIEPTAQNWETVRQMYYRKRKQYKSVK